MTLCHYSYFQVDMGKDADKNQDILIFCSSGTVKYLHMFTAWQYWLVHHFGSDWNISIAIRWTTVKFCADTHVFLRINCTNFGDQRDA